MRGIDTLYLYGRLEHPPIWCVAAGPHQHTEEVNPRRSCRLGLSSEKQHNQARSENALGNNFVTNRIRPGWELFFFNLVKWASPVISNGFLVLQKKLKSVPRMSWHFIAIMHLDTLSHVPIWFTAVARHIWTVCSLQGCGTEGRAAKWVRKSTGGISKMD